MGVEQAVVGKSVENREISSGLTPDAIRLRISAMEQQLGRALQMPPFYGSDKAWKKLPYQYEHLSYEERLKKEEPIICLNGFVDKLAWGNNIILNPEINRFRAEGRPTIGKSHHMYLRRTPLVMSLNASYLAHKFFPEVNIEYRDTHRTMLSQGIEFIEHENEIKETYQNRGWDLTLPKVEAAIRAETQAYIAYPDPANAPHPTGGAIDCDLLYRRNHMPLVMGWNDEEDRPLRYADVYAMDTAYYQAKLQEKDLTEQQRKDYEQYQANRMILYAVMVGAGFASNPEEWWHFDYGTKPWAYRTGKEYALYGPIYDVIPNVPGARIEEIDDPNVLALIKAAVSSN